MTRDQLRQQINTMEALENVLSAIEDVAVADLDLGDRAELDLAFTDRTAKKSPIGFAHAIPRGVALAGLRAMQQALEQMLAKETA